MDCHVIYWYPTVKIEDYSTSRLSPISNGGIVMENMAGSLQEKSVLGQAEHLQELLEVQGAAGGLLRGLPPAF